MLADITGVYSLHLDHHHLLPSDPWIALVEFVIDGERVVRLDLKETLVHAFRQPGQAKATPKPLPILARGPTSPESGGKLTVR